MKKILFFSNNKNKIIEANYLFKNSKISVLNLNNFKQTFEPYEKSKGFAENAKIKSYYGYSKFGIPCFADDSGICIKALNDKPGVTSKRFFNKFQNKKEAFEYIIKKTFEYNNTLAYFKTSICLTTKIGHYIIFEGTINGNISNEPKGNNGFGYDPLFIPNGQNKTFAEMNIKQKNKFSHRAIAIKKLIHFLIN